MTSRKKKSRNAEKQVALNVEKQAAAKVESQEAPKVESQLADLIVETTKRQADMAVKQSTELAARAGRNGQQLLPPGFVDYMRSPFPASDRGQGPIYGRDRFG
ncbi:hypothetical protein [Bradyrhizobium sp. BWA-3-5]|uniref:hypothetical protein n=1 Tax=Bradyrhizobium sp. BWA-3-5 TaxID=3080013 RepID=UPI00293EDB2A|nr:hypothetical protein [Bradyrhizobium sp. BWA-3-5]WOH68000.1 hypothetical protein RX331_09900 [Bradyrhizobium sp. BWA-3-5]